MGKDVLSILIFAVFIVIFVLDKLPMATSAILGCAVMVLFGVCDISTAFGQFASTTVILLVAIQIVGVAMEESGFAAAFGRILTKFSGGKERVIILIAYLMAAFLSSFLTNVTVLAVFMPIIIGMGKNNKKINPLNLILPVLIGTAMGGISTLVGSSQQLTAAGLVEEAGFGVKVFDLTPVGVILILAGLLYSLFIGYPIGLRIWGTRDHADCQVSADDSKVINKRKILIMTLIFAFMILFYITTWIPTVLTAVLAAILAIITGCVEQKEAVKRINWDIVGRLGACLGMAQGLKQAGGIDLLSDFIIDLFGNNMTPFALFVLAVLITQILSLFISNSTAILVVLPIVISMSADMGLNLVPYAIGVAYGSSMGISSPLSGSTNQMTMAAGYKFRDYLKYGVLYDILCFLIIIAFVPMFFSLTL